MTLTSHDHHIPGSTTDDELYAFQPRNCGGPLVCESCQFEYLWFEDREAKRRRILPQSIKSLESQTLRKISAKLRSKNPEPNMNMHIPEYQLARTIHALADAIDGVADDI